MLTCTLTQSPPCVLTGMVAASFFQADLASNMGEGRALVGTSASSLPLRAPGYKPQLWVRALVPSSLTSPSQPAK